MVALAYTNIFTSNIDRLANFYCTLFDLAEINESRSPIFRGFTSECSSIGFSALDAYELLGLELPTGSGDHVLQTFDVGSEDEVRELAVKATELGAVIVKEPFATYYGWFQAVLRDPDGNAFRINFRGQPA